MKKLLLLILPLIVILNSCEKIDGKVVAGATTYQPLTVGSYWKYKSGTDSSTNTMTAATAIFNGKTYHAVTAVSSLYTGTQSGYFYAANHIYATRQTTVGASITLELTYLNDTLPVGGKWTGKITDSGNVNGVPAQQVGTILESGITKVVAGKTYTNVIHTQVIVQYNYGTGFTDATYYDYYIAKNIGVIKTEAVIVGFAGTTTGLLVDYSIK